MHKSIKFGITIRLFNRFKHRKGNFETQHTFPVCAYQHVCKKYAEKKAGKKLEWDKGKPKFMLIVRVNSESKQWNLCVDSVEQTIVFGCFYVRHTTAEWKIGIVIASELN